MLNNNNLEIKDGDLKIISSYSLNISSNSFSVENLFNFDVKFEFKNYEEIDKEKPDNEKDGQAGLIRVEPKNEKLTLVQLIGLKNKFGVSSKKMKLGATDNLNFYFSIYIDVVGPDVKNITLTFFEEEK